jgi:hypothetical protein
VGVKVRGPIRLVFSIAEMLRGRDRIERSSQQSPHWRSIGKKDAFFSSDA